MQPTNFYDAIETLMVVIMIVLVTSIICYTVYKGGNDDKDDRY